MTVVYLAVQSMHWAVRSKKEPMLEAPKDPEHQETPSEKQEEKTSDQLASSTIKRIIETQNEPVLL